MDYSPYFCDVCGNVAGHVYSGGHLLKMFCERHHQEVEADLDAISEYHKELLNRGVHPKMVERIILTKIDKVLGL